MPPKTGEPRQALRIAVLAWGIITVLVGVGLIVADYMVENRYVSLGLTSLSSAALSIAGALLITEWIIRPLYVRDLLETAKLSADIHNLGLRYIQTPSTFSNWPDLFAGAGDITVVAGNEAALRSGPWPAIMEAGRSSKRQVRIHISMELNKTNAATSLERQWRDNGCRAKGSTLEVTPHTTITQGLVVHCNAWIAATVADDPLNDEPPLLVFAQQSREPLVATLRRGVDRLDASTTPPVAGA